MFILSATPSSTFFTSTPRVSLSFLSSSSSSSSSSSRLCSVSVRFGARGPVFPCPIRSVKVRAMAEMVQDKDSAEENVACSGGERSHSRIFLDASTEEELLAGIRKEREEGRLPSNVASGMEVLYHNYKKAVFQSGNPRADEIVLSNMAVVFDRVFFDVEDPFVFSPYHKALREPFDYYMFGQSYIRPLVDFRNSYVGNISLFNEIEEKLQKGHNIVLMSNHQTEADPAIIALLLEATNPHIAESMTYIAGDRVLIDPLCKPFSKGRNLLCVYSKKHMYDDPELVEMKKKANTRSLKEMALLLRGGSQLIWIAPSGGRDRPDPHTNEWFPAPFDASSVDNMRRLAEHSGAPGHIYPLALLCNDIMPPPPQVEKEIGEERVISFHGAGLSVSPGISFSEIAAACGNPEKAKDAYSQAIYNSVTEQYNVLNSAIHGKQGLEASIPSVSLSQPWN
ncbi:glycerol-3-phosphate acyltransferase ATS12, chloroplastic [Corylus avellana]|uniref:glycerol-3-phosphate acyltransferase ATS12, chloroplastic n=1 Tax=Corylus avellana TaxID=13451 RepID=UPI00286A78D4|nr:glycerol-3-phosphate acyltransferase ATS12, chloroplastic [Corylus avellana]XP_059440787.1 glycerol-3-phosphate acyltransferase ATS12, chloroplastic [Corylus avellana]